MTKKPAENGANRKRAFDIRRKINAGEKVPDDDVAFLEHYTGRPLDDAIKARVGRSASASRVTEFRQEERAAAAEGDHVHPEAYGAQSRAEGMRADTLIRITHDLFRTVFEQQQSMIQRIFERNGALEHAHVGMMEAVRDNYLARTEAEADAIRLANLKEQAEQEGAGDDFDKFMKLMEMWESKGGKLPGMNGKKSKGKGRGPVIGNPLK